MTDSVSVVVVGECAKVMAALPEASVDAVVCDPPYGLEFMGKSWDRIDGWRDGGGFTKTGLGDRPTAWTSFGGETANPTCAKCGGRARGERKCSCASPDWKVNGEDFDEAGRALSRHLGMLAWHERWTVQALRVLKPGGHLLAFGGSRTSHWLAAALEIAGFEIRDTIRELNGEPGEPLLWLYGSGFPKSRDVSKAIDKAAGAERTEVVGVKAGHEAFVDRTDAHAAGGRSDGWDRPWRDDPEAIARSHARFAPATVEAAEWDGWGTALKPAHEPIIVARKPLARTVAVNVLEHGAGALNIDGCRVEFAGAADESESKDKNQHADRGAGPMENEVYGTFSEPRRNYEAPGRWPANVTLVHSDACRRVGEARVASDGHHPSARPASAAVGGPVGHVGQGELEERYARGELVEEWECAVGCAVASLDAQSGFGASRFFYTAKASRAERSAGLEGFEVRPLRWSSGEQNPGSFQSEGTAKEAKNDHPTVKPVALMRWLARLVTRPGGTVLDPFMGSGTTGIACSLEGFDFVGVEQEERYAEIARARIGFWREHGEDALRIVAEREVSERRREEIAETGQLDLLGGV